MLRLCPGDNLGVRYVLSTWFVEAGRDDDLAALFKAYRDDGDAGWSSTKALAAPGSAPHHCAALRAAAHPGHVLRTWF